MLIKKVISPNLVRACRGFLGKDPVANILPLGDLYRPLFGLSDVYSAHENNRIVGVCSIYRALSKPSIAVGGARPEVKQALVGKAIGEISNDFISLCDPSDINLFDAHATILQSRREQQMITHRPEPVIDSDVEVVKAGTNDLESLNSFYMRQHAEAWAPIQLEMGHYYCVKREGKIVSTAGVHIVTPQIAQLGNIITDEKWRGRGFATACTSTLAADLSSQGRIVSLFVRIDNAPAIHIYEKLGFHKVGDKCLVAMRSRGITRLGNDKI